MDADTLRRFNWLPWSKVPSVVVDIPGKAEVTLWSSMFAPTGGNCQTADKTWSSPGSRWIKSSLREPESSVRERLSSQSIDMVDSWGARDLWTRTKLRNRMLPGGGREFPTTNERPNENRSGEQWRLYADRSRQDRTTPHMTFSI